MPQAKRVVKMEYYFAKGINCSDRVSDKYLAVNNFGYTKNASADVKTYRENGRCDYQLIYINEGYADFLIENETVRIQKGNIVIIYPHEKNSYVFYGKSQFEYFWIHFSGFCAGEILKTLKLDGHIHKMGKLLFFEEIFSEMAREQAAENFTTESYLCAKLMLILTLISQKIYIAKSSVSKVIELMQKEKINESTNDDYAKICGVTTPHFIREFKKITNLSPHKYKTKLIIGKAVNLFETTSLSISEAAQILGFDDSLYFSRVFKKETGLSPKKYIEKNLKNH